MQRPGGGRINSSQRQKHQLVGHNAKRVPPAWKPSKMGGVPSAGPSSARVASAGAVRTPLNGAVATVEGKILISGLPLDVKLSEIEDLMKKTIGAVKDSFMIHNSQGGSKGMAIVTFFKTSDAHQARERYHKKVIDGRRPIKIEFIVDSDTIKAPPAAPVVQKPKSLFDRLGVQTGSSNQQQAGVGTSGGVKVSNGGLNVTPRQQTQNTVYFSPLPNQQTNNAHSQPHPHPRPPTPRFARSKPSNTKTVTFSTPQQRPNNPSAIPVHISPQIQIPPRKTRQKKGPKRVNKRQAMTIADLDAEMDEYNAQKPPEEGQADVDGNDMGMNGMGVVS